MPHKTRFRRAFTAIALLAVAGCSIGADLPAANAEVAKFRQMIDAGKCAEIYRTASPDLTATSSEAGWTQLCEAIHRKLGKLKSAKQVGWNDQFNNGNHILVLSYQAEYERGSATEEFDYRLVAGKAALAGYHINSNAMMVN